MDSLCPVVLAEHLGDDKLRGTAKRGGCGLLLGLVTTVAALPASAWSLLPADAPRPIGAGVSLRAQELTSMEIRDAMLSDTTNGRSQFFWNAISCHASSPGLQHHRGRNRPAGRHSPGRCGPFVGTA